MLVLMPHIHMVKDPVDLRELQIFNLPTVEPSIKHVSRVRS